LQIDSGPAAIGFILHAFGEPIKVSSSHAAEDLRFGLERIVGALSTLVLAAGFLLITLRSYLKKTSLNPMTTILAVLLLFIVTYRVGSPQFMTPVIFVAMLAANEMSKPDRIKLYVRLFLIGLMVFAKLMYYLDLVYLKWPAATISVLRIALTAELLIWTLRRTINKKGPKSRLYANGAN
jgi:hypothetical protein